MDFDVFDTEFEKLLDDYMFMDYYERREEEYLAWLIENGEEDY